uniref:C2H2-type domain-containing protein n=1 Tax=Ananas comosus var. bracteatus TaxID=296719 RepID=A0A6V7Q1I2_ANACO|nr:unnamed protein product [Ananas comosus var. bracteatus]
MQNPNPLPKTLNPKTLIPPPIPSSLALIRASTKRRSEERETAVGGGTCSLLKWVREDKLEALRETSKKPEVEDPKPKPTTERLYLCSYVGCGKIFVDFRALDKHVQTHEERKHVCHYEGCEKKFSDRSKLKRHFLVHTGKKPFKCHYEGCGKAFSLPFNLTNHFRTHCAENYHVCPHPECSRRFTDEYKLQSHIKTRHEKYAVMHKPKQTPQEKLHGIPNTPASASCDRPFVCPYEGCRKAYIHRYKLNLHLRKEHPDHDPPQNGKPSPTTSNAFDRASDQDAYVATYGAPKSFKRREPGKEEHNKKKSGPEVVYGEGYDLKIRTVNNTVEKQRQSEERYDGDDRSEETEEEGEMFDDLEYEEVNNEETEDED